MFVCIGCFETTTMFVIFIEEITQKIFRGSNSAKGKHIGLRTIYI